MTTLADAHNALAQAVSTVIPCAPYESDSITPLCAQVVAPAYDPRLVFSGTKQVYPFKVRVYGSRTVPEATFEALAPYRDPVGVLSLVAAIQDDANWTVDVDYASVTQVGEIVSVEIPPGAGTFYLAFEIDVEVVF